MILKLATGEKQWTFYDNLIRITHKLVPYSEAEGYEEHRLVGDIPEEGDRKVLWISALNSHGTEMSFIVTSMAFLMNDDGKTIERLY